MRALFLGTLIFTLVISSCAKHSDEEYASLERKIVVLEATNKQLSEKISSLESEIIQYQTSPEKVLANAKVLYSSKNLKELLEAQELLMKYHPESDATKEVVNLYAKAKAEHEAAVEAEKKKKIAEKEAAEKKRMQAVNKLKKRYDDVSDITWYQNPYFTHYTNTNLTSIYIGKDASSTWLRIEMSYTGDDWIFFEKAFLSYDGNTKELYFDQYQDKKSDNGGGDVWEWIDIKVSDDLLSFLRQMVNGKSIKMRLSGKYTKTRNLSAKEINGIKDVLLAYDVLTTGK